MALIERFLLGDQNMLRFCLVNSLAIALAGCVAPSLYQWGGYENDLYGAYKDPSKTEALRINLETQTALMENRGQRVAPGLYAELGTLYLQLGSADKAIEMYKKERETWPESKGLMTTLIQSLERRQKERRESEK